MDNLLQLCRTTAVLGIGERRHSPRVQRYFDLCYLRRTWPELFALRLSAAEFCALCRTMTEFLSCANDPSYDIFARCIEDAAFCLDKIDSSGYLEFDANDKLGGAFHSTQQEFQCDRPTPEVGEHKYGLVPDPRHSRDHLNSRDPQRSGAYSGDPSSLCVFT